MTSSFEEKIAKVKTALENVFLKKNLGSSNGGKSVATDSNGNIITEAKNNHTHNYIPNNADGSTTGNLTATTSGKGIITANSFKKNGGTSSQFLKADGSVDSSTYLKSGEANNYVHPSGTAKTGNPNENKTPAFGNTFTVTQFTSDSLGHITGATDRTVKIPNALGNGTTAGLSTNDYTTTEKTKLGNIAENANNYSHPTNLTALSSGLYKITTNNNGHVTAGTAVTSTDIANLGVKITDTTYTAATTTPKPDFYTGSVGSSAKYAKEDHIHPVHNGSCGTGTNTDPYLKIMTIKVTGTYADKSIYFNVIGRRARIHHVELSFLNQNDTDPQVRKFHVQGGDSNMYIAKDNTSTWTIYYKKQENYDNVYITDLVAGNQFTITYPNASATSLPSVYMEAIYERDNIGINLLQDTKAFVHSGNTSTVTGEIYNGCVVKKFNGNNSSYQDFAWDIPKEWLENGGIYTLSFWAKTYSTHGYVRTYFYQSNVTTKRLKSNGLLSNSDWNEGTYGDGATQFYINQGWTRYYVTYQLLDSGTFNSNKRIAIRLLSNSNADQNLIIAGVKFEKGDQATKYSESPFDAKLTASQNVVTDASGNIITEAKNNHTHSYISTTAGSVGTTNLANNSVTSDKLVATIILNGTSTAHNSLDNYTKLGFYYQSANTNTSYIDNLPEPGQAFWLFVEDWQTTNSTYTKQTLTHYNTNTTYTRIRNNNNWGRWTKLENNHEYIAGTQTAATGAWTGTSKYIDNLRTGTRIYYKLPYAGSGNATLTLTLADGTTVSKDVYYNNTTRMTTHFPANTVIPLVYDGTKWVSTMIQNTNNYDRVYGVYHILAGEKLTKNGLIACKKSDGKYYNIKANLAIDPTKPILWTGAEIASGGDSNNLYSAYPSVNIQTTVSGKTVTTQKRVFIEGDYTYNNGIFTISGNVFKSEDNLDNAYYIPIGASSSTTNLRFNNFDNNVYLNNTQESMFIPLSQEYNAIYHRPSSYTPSSHTHGNIDNSGILKISNTAQTNKPLITNSSGTIIAGAFGTSSGQFAEGNHTHTVPSYTLVQTIGPKNGVTANIYTDDRNVYIKYSGTASLTANTNLNLGTVNDAYRPKTGYEYGLIGHANANIYGAVENSGTLYIINKTTTTSVSVYGSIIYPLKSRLP